MSDVVDMTTDDDIEIDLDGDSDVEASPKQPEAGDGSELSSDHEEELEDQEEEASDDAEAPPAPSTSGRSNIPPPIPLGQKPASKSKATDDGGAPPPKRKRRNEHKPMKASERCGKCRNCLNPHWKKACSVARASKEPESATTSGAGDVAVNNTATTTTATSSETAAPSKKQTASTSADDPFRRALARIMTPSGGISQTKHMDVFMDLMKRANTLQKRTALVAVLAKSGSEVQEQFITKKGLLDLQSWLTQAIEAPTPKLDFITSLFMLLEKLPVTMAALSAPCRLGRLVSDLRKDTRLTDALRTQAKHQRAMWMALVEKAPKSETAAVTTAKQELQTKEKAKEQEQAAIKQAATKAKAADDGDMFAKADRKRAVAADPSVAAASKKPTTSVVKSITQNKAPVAAASAVGASIFGSLSAAAASSGLSSQYTPLPTASSSSLGGTTSSSFGSSSLSSTVLERLVTKTAADRAREAAARVPSPPPEELERHKKKNKDRRKIQWVDDGELELVRWFRKDELPIKAQQDVDFSVPPETVVQEEEPKFASAAKKEHLSEAEALRIHRKQEDEERSILETRLKAMEAVVEFYDPPFIALPSRAPGQGEESTEIKDMAARRINDTYFVPHHLDPGEPRTPQDMGIDQDIRQIPRIPLTIEEAKALQVAPVQQQQQQQVAAAPSLPTDLSASLAMLAASGAIPQQAPVAPPRPPANTTYTPRPPPKQYNQYNNAATNNPRPQQSRPRPPQQNTGGYRPHGGMLGLHRPQGGAANGQGDPTAAQRAVALAMQLAHGKRAGSTGPTICKFYNLPGGCQQGNKCKFLHAFDPNMKQ